MLSLAHTAIVPLDIEHVSHRHKAPSTVHLFPVLYAPSIRFDEFVTDVRNNRIYGVTLQQNQKYLDATMYNGDVGRVTLPTGYDVVSLLLASEVEIDVATSYEHPRIFDVILAVVQIMIIKQLTKSNNDIVNAVLSNMVSVVGVTGSDVMTLMSSSDADLNKLAVKLYSDYLQKLRYIRALRCAVWLHQRRKVYKSMNV